MPFSGLKTGKHGHILLKGRSYDPVTWRCPWLKRPPLASKFNYQLLPLALRRLFAVSRSQEVVPLGLWALVQTGVTLS